MKENNFIEYSYKIDDGSSSKEIKLKLNPDRQSLAGVFFDPIKNPSCWTRLEFNKCPECPLSEPLPEHCPAALSIERIVDEFKDEISYRKVQVEVSTPERKISGTFPAQQALSSVMGLCLALSGCPVLQEFSSMARFHLPFATSDETIYRSMGNYLLKQYFIYKNGGEADWDLEGLEEFYRQVACINACLADRVRGGIKEDAAVNAVIILDNYAKNVEYLFERSLANMKKLFFEK